MTARVRNLYGRSHFEDKDYLSYLEIKYISSQRGRSLERSDNPINNDNDDFDSQYVMFLNNTKQKGIKSYVTALEENGLLIFIDYEKEGSSSDEWDENNNLSSKVKNMEYDSEGSTFEEVMIDGDYKGYLEIRYGNHQEGDAERGYNPDHNKDDANGNEDYDPDYVMFLNNIKHDGVSYGTAFEENGLLMFIDYEKEGSSSDEWDENNNLSSTVKNRKHDSDGSNFEEEIMIDGDYKRYLEIRYGSHQEGDAERGYNPDHNKDDANGNKDYDPDYMMFLNSFKHDGVSYATAFEANGVRTFINYEKEGNHNADRNDDLTCALKKGRKGDKVEGNNWKNVKGKMSNGAKGGLGSSEAPNIKEDEMVQPFTPLPKGERVIHKNVQRRITRSNSMKKQKTSQTVLEENYVDKDYALLLQAMKVHCEEHASKTVSPNKHAVEYDHDDSGDDEVVEIDYSKFSNVGRSHSFSPQMHYCEVGNTFEPVCKDAGSEFRQKVITFLKRPFDQTEYEKLLHDAKLQKPVERNLELRHGRDKYCPLDRIGKSYLDYFEDFNNKFEQAGSNKYKTLNILRGFFFWLQNITQEGAFKPWKDPTCLAVIPGFG
ncbi:unnamed protein product [Cuscuta europaea]|uniref:Uncharacterized protein n=1 Tax=Cuscuta europaea TaxID=41803 RepID=A0A9P1EEV1_CUSEU|nr:unnamed protein product [Cuscuta europaea]